MHPEPEWIYEASTDAQKNCPHKRKHRKRSEALCLKCGGRKDSNGKWMHLTREWFDWYMRGGVRPGLDRRKEPRYMIVKVK